MSSEADRLFFQRKTEINTACQHLLDAFVALTNFTNGTAGWDELAIIYPDTGPALLASLKQAGNVQAMVRLQHEQLAAVKTGFAEAWQRHQDAVASNPRPHPVTADERIAKSLAVQWQSIGADEDPEPFLDMLADLGLEPEGPTWAQWGLAVHNDRLWWTPYLPAEDDDEPERPWTGDDEAAPGTDPWSQVETVGGDRPDTDPDRAPTAADSAAVRA